MSTEEALSVPITKGGFSNDGSEIIQRTLETSVAAASFHGVSKTLYCSGIPLNEYYELDHILAFILRTGAKKVRFQSSVSLFNFCFFFFGSLHLSQITFICFYFLFLYVAFVVIDRSSIPR